MCDDMTDKDRDFVLNMCICILVIVLALIAYGFLSSRVEANEPTWISSYMTVTATAYCACEVCCGRWSKYKKTATGTSAMSDGVAVDPSYIPLGSRIDIPKEYYNRGPNNNGSWILCDDTGSSIKGLKIDLRFSNHNQAILFGKKKIKVRIWQNK